MKEIHFQLLQKIPSTWYERVQQKHIGILIYVMWYALYCIQ